MSTLRVKTAWASAVLLAAAALVWRLVPLPDAQGRIATLTAGPGQRLDQLELTPEETEFFGRARAARWLAQGSGAAMIVTVVDGTGNRRAVHDPSYCFRGAGWTVVEEKPLALAHGEAVRVKLRREHEELEAVYWFSNGHQAYGSPVHYWMESTLRRLTLGGSGDESLLVLLVPARDRVVDWTSWLGHWPQWSRL